MNLVAVFLLFLSLLSLPASGHDLRPCAVPRAGAPLAVVPIDLNAASAEELETLPGIGPAMAGRIVDFRDGHGPFTRLEQLGEVRGIGPRTLEKLRPYLTLSMEED